YPAPLVWPGFMPMQVGRTFFMPNYRENLARAAEEGRKVPFSVGYMDDREYWTTVLGSVSVLVYGAGAAGLTWGAVRRVRHGGRPPATAAPAAPTVGRTPGIAGGAGRRRGAGGGRGRLNPARDGTRTGLFGTGVT